MRGDAGDRALMARLTASTPPDAVVHTVHAAYDHRVWRTELPPREQAVMGLAAGIGIPVVFPESVYAWGDAARDLTEGTPVAPTTPLGEVRIELLAARAAHSARTLSIVAADLIGPTAATSGSMATALVVRPAAAGRRVWLPGDPAAPHALTQLPDLARALRHTAVLITVVVAMVCTARHCWPAPGRPLGADGSTDARCEAGCPLLGWGA